MALNDSMTGEKNPNYKHGKSSTPEYRIWQVMIQRCHLETSKDFGSYGGRGITVCERWRYSFLNFLEDMGTREKGMEIERMDNDGNYEPENCEWVTRTTQNRNKRNNRLITVNGQTKTMVEWAEEKGLSVQTISGRLNNYGWSEEDSVMTPARFTSHRKKKPKQAEEENHGTSTT